MFLISIKIKTASPKAVDSFKLGKLVYLVYTTKFPGSQRSNLGIVYSKTIKEAFLTEKKTRE